MLRSGVHSLRCDPFCCAIDVAYFILDKVLLELLLRFGDTRLREARSVADVSGAREEVPRNRRPLYKTETCQHTHTHTPTMHKTPKPRNVENRHHADGRIQLKE